MTTFDETLKILADGDADFYYTNAERSGIHEIVLIVKKENIFPIQLFSPENKFISYVPARNVVNFYKKVPTIEEA